jgi:hypothetical protein
MQTALMKRRDWSVRLECRARLAATIETFQFSGELEAYEGDRLVKRHDWTLAIPRSLL